MSDATHDALEAAIRAHVLDEAEGAYLTEWVVYAAAEDLTDSQMSHYVSSVSKSISSHRLVGLVEQLRWKAHYEWTQEQREGDE